jgi:hypothetical protein
MNYFTADSDEEGRSTAGGCQKQRPTTAKGHTGNWGMGTGHNNVSKQL